MSEGATKKLALKMGVFALKKGCFALTLPRTNVDFTPFVELPGQVGHIFKFYIYNIYTIYIIYYVNYIL